MPGRILLVDDDADLLELYELYFAMHGNTVRTATSGRDALGIVETWPPHVALLDVRMPDMDGFELIRTLRTAGHGFPICLYTAYDTKEATRTALDRPPRDGHAGRGRGALPIIRTRARRPKRGAPPSARHHVPR
jgi:CheY-like chemotaxis protein